MSDATDLSGAGENAEPQTGSTAELLALRKTALSIPPSEELLEHLRIAEREELYAFRLALKTKYPDLLTVLLDEIEFLLRERNWGVAFYRCGSVLARSEFEQQAGLRVRHLRLVAACSDRRTEAFADDFVHCYAAFVGPRPNKKALERYARLIAAIDHRKFIPALIEVKQRLCGNRNLVALIDSKVTELETLADFD